MHDAQLMDLLAEVLGTHGYECTRHAALEGRTGTIYTIPLLAEREDGALVIDADLGSDPLPLESVTAVSDVMHDVGADHAVLCHLGALTSGIAQPGVRMWGRDLLVHIIGEAKLCAAIGTGPEPLQLEDAPVQDDVPIAESLDELLPDAFQDQEAAVDDEPRIDLEALERLATDPEPSAPVEEKTVPDALVGSDEVLADDDAPTPAPSFGHQVLPVRVTPDEARLAIRDRLETVDMVQMALQPVHLFDYECDLLVEGSLRYDTVQGRVQVHGTDKTVVEVDREAVDPEGFTRMPRLPGMPSHERTLRVGMDSARRRTTDFLMASHSRVVDIEVDDEDNGFSYTEKKKVAPRPDHVRLHLVGTFHRIIWRCTGPMGHVDVDALTGDIVEEALQHPRNDAMMIE